VNRSSIVRLAARRQGIARTLRSTLTVLPPPAKQRVWIHAEDIRDRRTKIIPAVANEAFLRKVFIISHFSDASATTQWPDRKLFPGSHGLVRFPLKNE